MSTLPRRSTLRRRFGLLILSISLPAATASQCVAFDSSFNAYVFGASYGDVSLGTNITQPASFMSITDIPGRPAFDGNNTQCFINQFTDGLYVLGASSNSSDVHIFDFLGQTWSTQTTSGGPLGDYVAILDHDTTTLYAFGNGTLSSLAFSESAAKASSSFLQWQDGAANNDVPFTSAGYQPVLGAANNHIQFLNTPGSAPGDAYIYVIHYADYQAAIQSFGDFPTASGHTATIASNSSAAPNEFAFIPNNASSTYIIDAKSNTTTTFAAPPITDPLASYAASTTQLLQITSNGTLAYLDFTAASNVWITITMPNMTALRNSTTLANSTSGSKASNGLANSQAKAKASSAMSNYPTKGFSDYIGDSIRTSYILPTVASIVWLL